ncbi:hypothetical protein [Nonomuraea endophytica]|uniref:Twin-arginine translocation signal domain-containing protein n=1 Tax=Nonomuraea endophytica TaxID=714136 RepID=A0A7W8A4H4_9ACTN|nr:hypothetical protein [Nonomuraea endophytica]MBB5079441.1 hypothetical protein [Nonomuraea endophytica]
MDEADSRPDATRRSFLLKAAGLGVAAAFAGAAVGAGPALAEPNMHAGWRTCQKCLCLFYWGFSDSGQCPKDFGTHQSGNSPFYRLPWGGGWTPNDQPDWRCCHLCLRIFFAGYLSWANCTLARSHRISSPFPFNYVLPHDFPQPPGYQANWRYCTTCQTLFYSGHAWQGVCKYGAPHQAAGYNFVIPVN